MTTLSISEARKDIFKIADNVQKTGRYYTLTDRGAPKVVLMSADEFESWKETLEVQRMFPDLAEDIKEAEKDFKRGDYITLDEVLAKEGYVVADKSKKKYGVQGRNTKKSSKKFR